MAGVGGEIHDDLLELGDVGLDCVLDGLVAETQLNGAGQAGSE